MKCQHYGFDYAVIGGDLRQVYLAEELACRGSQICCYALCAEPDAHRTGAGTISQASSLSQACSSSSCILCPIPLCKNGDFLNQSAFEQALPASQVLQGLEAGQCLFAGCIPEDFHSEAEADGVHVFDLMEDFRLSVFNSIATAEGAICEAIKRSPMNLHQSSCAVLGYGKCGRTLCHYLKGISCHIYAVSDQEDERTQAALIADGTGTLEDFRQHAGEFDFVFNTIPSLAVDANVLARMKSSITIIDIASAPGGVDFPSAEKLGIRAVLCPGLPGKYAPASSARAIAETIERIQKE